jgi:hypothetical protein
MPQEAVEVVVPIILQVVLAVPLEPEYQEDRLVEKVVTDR